MRQKLIYGLLLTFFFINPLSYSQVDRPRESDSLRKIINELKRSGYGRSIQTDTALIRNLNFLGRSLFYYDLKTSKQTFSYCLALTDSLYKKTKTIPLSFYNKATGYAYFAISNILAQAGDVDSTVIYVNRSLQFINEKEEPQNVVKSYTALANMYLQSGDNNKAIDYLYRALRVSEKYDFKTGIASSYQKLSNFYCYQGKFKDALPLMEKCVAMRETINGETVSLIGDYNNLANIYGELKRIEESFNLLQKALKISKEASLPGSEAVTLNNLSYYYMDRKDFNTALKYGKESYELRKKMGDRDGILKSMLALSSIYQLTEKNNDAISILKEAMALAKEMNNTLQVKSIYQEMAAAYYASKKYKEAFDFLSQYNLLKDSMLNETVTRQTAEMQTKYETEKKDKANQLLNAENKLSSQTIKEQKIISYVIITVLLLVLGLAYFIFRGLKQQRKANRIISEQKLEVENAKVQIEEKQKEVMDSIHYAKKIQSALITNERYIERTLNKLQNKKI